MGAHVPYQLMQAHNKATRVDTRLIPQAEQAVSDYRLGGGRITDPDQDINDPLFNDMVKMDIRFQSFIKRFPSFEAIFHNLVNENVSLFVDALTYFIDLTFRLCHS